MVIEKLKKEEAELEGEETPPLSYQPHYIK